MSAFKRIVVAVDLSAASAPVMKAAVEIGRAMQAELHIVHVHKIHAANLIEGDLGDADTLVAQQVAKLEAQLEQFAAQYTGAGIIITLAVSSGDPCFEINHAVESTGADMLIMGTHGRTGIAHLVLGSVAESVLRHARVPVVVIRINH